MYTQDIEASAELQTPAAQEELVELGLRMAHYGRLMAAYFPPPSAPASAPTSPPGPSAQPSTKGQAIAHRPRQGGEGRQTGPVASEPGPAARGPGRYPCPNHKSPSYSHSDSQCRNPRPAPPPPTAQVPAGFDDRFFAIGKEALMRNGGYVIAPSAARVDEAGRVSKTATGNKPVKKLRRWAKKPKKSDDNNACQEMDDKSKKNDQGGGPPNPPPDGDAGSPMEVSG